jgi:hypothetical protein
LKPEKNFVLNVCDIDGRLLGEIPEEVAADLGIKLSHIDRADISTLQMHKILAHPAFRPIRGRL